MSNPTERETMRNPTLLLIAIALTSMSMIACGPAEVHHHWYPDKSKSASGSETIQKAESTHMEPSRSSEKNCKSSSNCWGGAICLGGKCVETKLNWECAIHADCTTGNVCSWGKCIPSRTATFSEPQQHSCTDNEQCSVLNPGAYCNSSGSCGTTWHEKDGLIKGCTVYYDVYADDFRFSDDKGRFNNQSFKIAILAFKEGKPFVVISKTAVDTSKTAVNIPHWATGFQLITSDGEKMSMYECVGEFAAFVNHYEKDMGGKWITRNSK